MAARAVIVPRVVVFGVWKPGITVSVSRVVMPFVGVGQPIMRIPERDALQRFRRVFRTFRLAKRDVMRRRVVEDQVSGPGRRRKPLGGTEPHNIRTVQQLRWTAADLATEAVFDRRSVRPSHAPFHHPFVVARQNKAPVPDKSEMWTDLYGDRVLHVVVRVMDAPSVVGLGFARS